MDQEEKQSIPTGQVRTSSLTPKIQSEPDRQQIGKQLASTLCQQGLLFLQWDLDLCSCCDHLLWQAQLFYFTNQKMVSCMRVCEFDKGDTILQY